MITKLNFTMFLSLIISFTIILLPVMRNEPIEHYLPYLMTILGYWSPSPVEDGEESERGSGRLGN